MKKTLSFRILSLLFALVFLVMALPLGIFANDTETTAETAVANDGLTATVSEGVSLLPTGYEDEPTFPEEIQELRTENVKHFDKGDGTYEAIAYGGAVHRKDADGKWQDIDNTLTLRDHRGAERYVDADARISFAPAASSGTALWQLSENGYSISLSLADADLRAGAAADVKNHASRAEQIAAAKKADDTDALFRVDNTTKILYRNVLANVDLEYILSGNDVKETILVQNVCENYNFPFRLSLSGLIPKTTDDGAILLCDAESGKEVYLLPAPYMTDADDSYSDAVSYRLTDLGEGEYEIIVSASDEWINAPERAFPVAIDPTVTSSGSSTADTYVNSSTGSQDQNNGYKQFSWISNEKITLIKSVGMPELPPGATVAKAQLAIAYYFVDGSTSGSISITAHRSTLDWVETGPYGVTWNSLSSNGTNPTLGFTSAISTTELMAASSYPQWANINITDAVQFWYSGSTLATTYNYGIGLKRSSGKSIVNLRTKEYSSAAYAPYFTVSYYISNGVCALYNFDTSRYLTVGNPLMSGQTSYDPSARDSLFKIAYRPATNDYVIRSMVNNEFVVYHNLSMHKPLSESATANGVTVQDEAFDGSFVWKIGVHPNYPDGSRFAIWNVSGGQNYYLAAEMTVYGCSIKFTTSVSDPGTSWDFIDEYDTSMRGVVLSGQSVQHMIIGETIDFDYYMYDYRPGVNGPVSYAIYDTNWGPSTLATVNSTTGVCTANGVGTFRLGVSYPNAPWIWGFDITVEYSRENTYYIKNRQRKLYAQIDDNDAPNYSNNGGIMEIWPFDGGNYQRWILTYVGRGYYKITSAVSGYAITVPTGQETNDDVNLILKPYSGTNNQKWRITDTSGSAVKIKAKSSESYTAQDLVMDLESLGNNQPGDGLIVRQRQYMNNSSYNDEWFLQEIDDSYKIIFCGITNAGHDHYSALKTAAGYLSDTTTNDVSIYTGSVLPTDCNNYLKNCKVFASRSYGDPRYTQFGTFSTGIILNDLSGANRNGFYSEDFSAISSGSYYIHSTDYYSNLGLALFMGCETGRGGVGGNNLPSRIVAQGATSAIGFELTFDCESGNAWTRYFFEYFCEGYDVYSSVDNACRDLADSDNADLRLSKNYIIICGDDSYCLGD